MRLDRAYIDGFKNLKEVSVDFDETRLTTVIIGENGAGKSNLIEAITDVFRFVDMNRGAPRYTYELDYRIRNHAIRLSNRSGKHTITVDESNTTRAAFERDKATYFPDLVFGYYSGGSRRLESLFDSHQRRYYGTIIKRNNAQQYWKALEERRLFYCRPIHGVFALLSFFAFPDESVTKLLTEKLGVTGFHSALAHFRAPSWFSPGKPQKISQAPDFWGARGLAGECAVDIKGASFHPITLTDRPIDDYREKGREEIQYACFLRNIDALRRAAIRHKNSESMAPDQAFFSALEAVDISDLLREMYVWVTRNNDDSGDVSFSDLSDGERQLLMVLGLIRISRGKEALFLLDEPDTHLNPLWQHTYLDLIREWTGVAAEPDKCQIIMNSHNPLTVSSLERDEVRVMHSDKDGSVRIDAPYADPKGMGFTATLTEIFGMPTSVDADTQRVLDDRNTLAKIDERTEEQERQLIEITDKLNRLGFMFEDREPLYQDFLRSWQAVRYSDRPPLTPVQISQRQEAMKELIASLLKKKEGS